MANVRELKYILVDNLAALPPRQYVNTLAIVEETTRVPPYLFPAGTYRSNGVVWLPHTDSSDLVVLESKLQSKMVISSENSSDTILIKGGSFTSDGDDVSVIPNATAVVMTVATDQPGTMYAEFSSDGENWDRTKEYPILGSASLGNNAAGDPIHDKPHTLLLINKFFRVRFSNSGNTQGYFRLQTIYTPSDKPLIGLVNETIDNDNDVQLVKAVVSGENSSGDFGNVIISPSGGMTVDLANPLTAFGEISVAETSPVLQVQFPYDFINTGILASYTHNLGSTAQSDSMLEASSGAATSSFAFVRTLATIKYEPGEGIVSRFTGLYDTEVEGNQQYVGIGNESNGYFFGFNGTDFGILHRKFGSVVLATLQVTAGTSGAGNVTITLNGVAEVVALSNHTGDIGETANEISAHDFSDVGGGWSTWLMGDIVVFKSFKAEARGGAYTYAAGATGSTATISQTVAGVAPTDNHISQSNWNIDKADGNSVLPVMDHRAGNVFQVVFPFLGFGAIKFYVKGEDGFILVHRIPYTNSFTLPSLSNPTMPLWLISDNDTNNTDITVKTASMFAGVQGQIKFSGPIRTAESTKPISSGLGETIVISIRNKMVFGSKENQVRSKVYSITLANESSTKIFTFRFYVDAPTSGAISWTATDTNSPLEYDTAGTSVIGSPSPFESFPVAPNSTFNVPISTDIFLLPGSTLTVTAEKSAGGLEDVTVTVNFIDDI